TPLLGVTFAGRLFGRGDACTAYLGGARHPRIAELPDDRLGALAAREVGSRVGSQPEPVAVGRARMPAWDRSWRAVRDLRLPPGLHVAGSWRSRPGIPGRLAEAARLARALAGADERAGARALAR
ncbi:MAG TPA: hypothetical protein VFQ22_09660, partial [Longimicrobiales bacterium]|nr:hypothetical protein [Longimicrobiales bacterium]